MTGNDLRRQVLSDIEKCVCQDRRTTYGDAEDSFNNIAGLVNVTLARKLKEPLNALDIALFAICLKLGRLATNPTHYDSVLDLGGYSVCAAGILKSLANGTQTQDVASESNTASE